MRYGYQLVPKKQHVLATRVLAFDLKKGAATTNIAVNERKTLNERRLCFTSYSSTHTHECTDLHRAVDYLTHIILPPTHICTPFTLPAARYHHPRVKQHRYIIHMFAELPSSAGQAGGEGGARYGRWGKWRRWDMWRRWGTWVVRLRYRGTCFSRSPPPPPRFLICTLD